MTFRLLASRIFLALLSSALLILAFPTFNIEPLAWVGLIPLLTALEGRRTRSAFGLAYLSGVVFFAGTLYWFVNVTVAGAILMMLYLGLYFGVFGALYTTFRRMSAGWQWVMIPSSWVVLEYLRGHLFSGFGWAALAHSQYKAIPIIQIADVTGFYGVSFLIVLVNLTVYRLAGPLRRKTRIPAQVRRAAIVTACLLAAVCLYGAWRMATVRGTGILEAVVVQGNTPEEDKWQPNELGRIVVTQMDLSWKAMAAHPDLVIWPETAYPGYRWIEPHKFQIFLDGLKQLKKPVLFGAVTKTGNHYYNAALLAENGRVVKSYHKMHLVPFGEYIPLRHWLPFLAKMVPIDDFTPGKQYTLFDVPDRLTGRSARLAALICYEDTVPELARVFTLHGARALVNMTNDAWFGNTNAPYMHLAAAVFRTVENRRSLIRAANTGVSGVVDLLGRVRHEVVSGGRATYVAGWTRAQTVLNDRITWYTRHGDVFVWLCLVCLAAGALVNGIKNI